MTATATTTPQLICSDSIGGDLVMQDGIVYYLTSCCQASGKGGEHGVICRACYRPVSDVYGMGWLVNDHAAWAQYAMDLVPSLEQFAVKFAYRAQDKAAQLDYVAKAQ